MQRKVLAYLLTTPFWSVMSTLLHLVGLRPQVYYTLTNLRGGGGGASPLGQWRSEGNWRPGAKLNFAPPPLKNIL